MLVLVYVLAAGLALLGLWDLVVGLAQLAAALFVLVFSVVPRTVAWLVGRAA